MDLARYADSAGYADDPPRTIWAYRDWVIRSINNNKPFDQFTIEQLAGDLLPNPSDDQLLATAFHRNTLTNNEGGTQDEEFRNVAVVDRVNTTMAVWMGTTIACAQCHSHKFDPISQTEYFQFFAILNSTQDADRRDESPVLPIYTAEQRSRQAKLKEQIADLRAILDTPSDALVDEQRQWERQLQGDPLWSAAQPESVTRSSLGTADIDEGLIRIKDAAEQDVYTVDLRLDAGADRLTAIRLETQPDASLPQAGSGHGGGNFVITGVKLQMIPPGETSPRARYLRITNQGSQQILSLAEVQVLSGGRNIALQGVARQHSTAYDGPAELAIDGDTNGDYQKKSVTHTETVDDPWWELDLGADSSIERIAIWNRTDNNLHTRLKNFSVELLDAQREVIWRKELSDSPNPSLEVLPSSIRDIPLVSATADYHQPGFEPADVLRGAVGAQDGWAVGGAAQTEHALILAPARAWEWPSGSVLRMIIEQQSPHKNHLLGGFRVSTTSHPLALRRAQIPPEMLAIVDLQFDQRSDEDQQQLAAFFRANIAPSLADQRAELARAEVELREMKPATSAPILRELSDHRETRLQYRGNYLDKGPVIDPGLPAVFHRSDDERPLDRLAMAKWLVDEDNPLTARVIVNRFWETLFGRGIVLTSEEFGSQGEPPTHPELLDWLAVELMESGWDTKNIIRTIVTSAVYRQSSKVVDQAADVDPDNRWLARGPRVRLSAEMVRDQALAVSGLLSDKMFGPPVKPPQPNLGLTAAFGGSTDWKASQGADRYRRGVYTTWRRSNPYPSMAAFDAPNREVCTVRRNRTNTPLQSLVTLNDPVYVEAAQALARRALQHDQTLPEQLAYAFRCCVARPPTAAELDAMASLYTDARAEMGAKAEDAKRLAVEPRGPLPAGIEAADAAAMTVVGNVLLNLDEMFLKR